MCVCDVAAREQSNNAVHDEGRDEAEEKHAAPCGGGLRLGSCLGDGDQVRRLVGQQEKGSRQKGTCREGVGDALEGFRKPVLGV